MTGAPTMLGPVLVQHQHQHPAYVSKWVTFAASAILQASAGLSYAFSVYGPTIKDALDLSQTQVATVGSALNLGGYFAIISGSIYDHLKDQFTLGPRLVVWLGCLCCFCGYLGMFLMVSGAAPKSFLQLLLFATAAGNMGTWFDTSALVTNVRNFPNDRGCVVGVLKSFLGLSSSIYTSVYACFFEPDATRFLLMLAVVPTLLGAAMSCCLNYVPYVEASELPSAAPTRFSVQGRFLMSFLMVGALALYQMASAVLAGARPLSQGAKAVTLAGMAALLCLAACLPLAGCGGWRAAYGHGYLHTRESCLDDEDGDESRPGGPPGSPAGPPPCGAARPAGGCGRSREMLPGHTSAPHHRAAPGQLRTLKEQAGARQRAASPTPAGMGPGSSGHSHSAGNLAGLGASRDSYSGGRSAMHARNSSADEAAAQEGAPLLAGLAAGAEPKGGPPTGLGGLPSPGAAAASPSLGLARGGHAPPREAGGSGGAAQLHVGSLTTRQMLGTTDFWLLFFQFTVACGVCLAFLNNLGQVVVSLGGGHDGQVVFVSLFSVANAAGRLLMGYIPEQYLHARGTPRTLFLTLTAALLTVSCLACAYAHIAHLYAVSLLLGLVFGAHWSLLPAITSDLFGLKHFAGNYTTLQFAPAAGSYLLATRLTGYFYDRTARDHGDPHQCIGPDCFRVAFLLMSVLSGLGSIACIIATSRSRRAYLAVAQHLRQVQAAEDAASGERGAR